MRNEAKFFWGGHWVDGKSKHVRMYIGDLNQHGIERAFFSKRQYLNTIQGWKSIILRSFVLSRFLFLPLFGWLHLNWEKPAAFLWTSTLTTERKNKYVLFGFDFAMPGVKPRFQVCMYATSLIFRLERILKNSSLSKFKQESMVFSFCENNLILGK